MGSGITLTKPVKDISEEYVIIEKEEKKTEEKSTEFSGRPSTGDTGAPFDIEESTIDGEDEDSPQE